MRLLCNTGGARGHRYVYQGTEFGGEGAAGDPHKPRREGGRQGGREWIFPCAMQGSPTHVGRKVVGRSMDAGGNWRHSFQFHAMQSIKFIAQTSQHKRMMKKSGWLHILCLWFWSKAARAFQTRPAQQPTTPSSFRSIASTRNRRKPKQGANDCFSCSYSTKSTGFSCPVRVCIQPEPTCKLPEPFPGLGYGCVGGALRSSTNGAKHAQPVHCGN